MNSFSDQRSHLTSWVDRRIRRGWFRLKVSRSESYEMHKHLGGRSIYASVTLSAQPSDTFSFHSTAAWPSEDYTSFVQDGILDAIFPTIYPIFGVSVTLESIKWHEIDSCASAYQVAATEAMKKILDGNMDLTKRHTEQDAAANP
jgi:hypothetical protein